MSRWELRIEEPGKPPVTVAGRARLRLGRHPDNDVVVADPKCSSFHVELREDADGGLVLVDCGSTNQTRVASGVTLGKDETCPLVDGMRAFVGRTVIHFTRRPELVVSPSPDTFMDPEFAAQDTVPGSPVAAPPPAETRPPVGRAPSTASILLTVVAIAVAVLVLWWIGVLGPGG